MPAPAEGEPADTMRQMEREIMLQLMDQRWREHLSEMDYLREGINLRSLGQKDPLTEWQRDGYEMFGQLMSSIDDDYVKYVMHAQVQVQDRPALEPSLAGAQYLAPEGPVLGPGHCRRPGRRPGARRRGGRSPPRRRWRPCAGAVGRPARDGRAGRRRWPRRPRRLAAASEFDNAGRNDPCPCGSGKKFKFCHGR